jgi:hypothetical protein
VEEMTAFTWDVHHSVLGWLGVVAATTKTEAEFRAKMMFHNVYLPSYIYVSLAP